MMKLLLKVGVEHWDRSSYAYFLDFAIVYDANIIYHEPWMNFNFRKNLMFSKLCDFKFFQIHGA